VGFGLQYLILLLHLDDPLLLLDQPSFQLLQHPLVLIPHQCHLLIDGHPLGHCSFGLPHHLINVDNLDIAFYSVEGQQPLVQQLIDLTLPASPLLLVVVLEVGLTGGELVLQLLLDLLSCQIFLADPPLQFLAFLGQFMI
jgi:hypothetical protein